MLWSCLQALVSSTVGVLEPSTPLPTFMFACYADVCRLWFLSLLECCAPPLFCVELRGLNPASVLAHFRSVSPQVMWRFVSRVRFLGWETAPSLTACETFSATVPCRRRTTRLDLELHLPGYQVPGRAIGTIGVCVEPLQLSAHSLQASPMAFDITY